MHPLTHVARSTLTCALTMAPQMPDPASPLAELGGANLEREECGKTMDGSAPSGVAGGKRSGS